MSDSTNAVQSTTPHDPILLQAAMRSIACMMDGREPVFPMEVTLADPQGLIARLRIRKVGGEAQIDVLEIDDLEDSDAPLPAPMFPLMMCAIDASGAKFSCVMYEDMSPVGAA